MQLSRFPSLLFVAALLILTLPQFAEARAGGGRSVGSRGTHTYQAVPRAKPIERTATSNPGANTPSGGQAAPAPAPTRSFWGGLAGGLLGAGLFSMLFGHSFMGGGGGMLGTIILVAWLFYLYQRFKGRGLPPVTNLYPMNNTQSNFTRSTAPYSSPTHFTPVANNVPTQDITITDSDKTEFEALLLKIQKAWSEADMSHLRQYVTPEMLQYFSEELSANSSRGLANKIEQVVLVDAGVEESWHEYEMDYATVQLKWTALDYMTRLDRAPSDADYLASGSNTLADTAEEIWTFTRASGGHWLLSAIQQVTS